MFFRRIFVTGFDQRFSQLSLVLIWISCSAFSVRHLDPEDFHRLTLFLEELVTPILLVEAVMECSEHDQTFILIVEKRIIGFFMVELSH
jgi:hypothetical protein